MHFASAQLPSPTLPAVIAWATWPRTPRVADAIQSRNEKEAEQAMEALLLDVERTIQTLDMPADADPAQGGEQ